MKPVFVVDSHHNVLLAWARYRRGLSAPPSLITLDHHTDTSPPFRNYIARLNGVDGELIREQLVAKIDFSQDSSIQEAINKLSNDEHIVAAIGAGIVSSAFVIAHNAMNTDLSCYRKHKIVCREVKGSEWDQVLESHLLNRALLGFNEILAEAGESSLLARPYILDIDLDYFNTFRSAEPGDATAFRSLINGAGLITVATEPEYVKSCARDAGLTSEHLFGKIRQYF